MDKKIKAFVYLRRSQDRADRQVLSIEGQRKEIKALLDKEGLAPIWLPAEERSAHKSGRPIFNDMMKRIEAGEARVVVTWSANRLARNALDGGRLIHYLHETKLLRIITPSRSYSSASMEDQFLLQIEFGMSKMYSDEISKNVRRGYRAKYERGEYPSHAPIGYINVVNGNFKNIAPDPDRASLVIQLFNEASKGVYTLKDIWLYARDELGLLSKKGLPVSRQTVFDLLQNIVYTGTFKHSGEYHLGRYQPLIAKELYDKVQVAMGWAKGGRNNGPNSTAGAEYDYKGPFVCGQCGHNLTAYIKRKKLAKTGEYAHYVYYVCTRKSKKVTCKDPQIVEQELAEQVGGYLSKINLTEGECKLALQYVRKFHKEHVNNRNTLLKVWEKDVQMARSKSDKLLNMRMDNEIDSETFKQEKSKYGEVIVRNSKLINDSDSNASQWLELAEEFFTNAMTLVETFQEADTVKKKRILLEIGSNWTLSNKKALFTPRKPYDLLLNRTDLTIWRARPDSNRRSPP